MAVRFTSGGRNPSLLTTRKDQKKGSKARGEASPRWRITGCAALSPAPPKPPLPPRRPGRWGGASDASSGSFHKALALLARASVVDSYERAWLISQQPRPTACSSCGSNGYVECKWCADYYSSKLEVVFFQGSACCPGCKGTGFRPKWLEKPQLPPK